MQCHIGKFSLATSANATITIGFKPDWIKLVNEDAANGEVQSIEWFGELQGVLKGFVHRISTVGTATTVSDAYDGSALDIEGIVEASTPSIVSANLLQSGGWGITIDETFMPTNGDTVWFIAIRADRVKDHGDPNA